jgi:hypothetical protein
MARPSYTKAIEDRFHFSLGSHLPALHLLEGFVDVGGFPLS